MEQDEAGTIDEEIQLLRHCGIPFAEHPPRGGLPVVSLLLRTRRADTVLYLGPRGWRANFKTIARTFRTKPLALASRFEVGDLLGRPPARLSPMAFGLGGGGPADVAIHRRLMAVPALGFAVGGGRSLWLAGGDLVTLLDELGCGFAFGDFARAPRGRVGAAERRL